MKEIPIRAVSIYMQANAAEVGINILSIEIIARPIKKSSNRGIQKTNTVYRSELIFEYFELPIIIVMMRISGTLVDLIYIHTRIV
jgi:hypothetical protein